MPRIPRHTATAVVTLSLVAAGCGQPPVQTGNDHVPDGNVEIARAKDGKFDNMVWPLVDTEMVTWLDGPFAPGCAVGVAIDDELVYLKGYGRSRLGLSAEDWGVGTMGSVGSVSKFLTALAAMRQVQNGWVDLEAEADDWLPLSGDLGDTRLYALLSHTAGAGGASKGAAYAPNWDDGSPIDDCAGVDTPDAADPACTEAHRHALEPSWLVESFAENEADNVASLSGVNVDDDPWDDGWQAVYSNVGYTVAGGIVGAVAQAHGYDGYEEYVWDAVGQWGSSWLTPGQATSLALIHQHRAEDIPHRAVGYYDASWEAGEKDWQPGEAWDVVSDGGHWIGPAGGWAITIGDLTRILIAFRENQIVSAANRSLMEFPMGWFSLGPEDSNLPPYGFGLLVHEELGTVYHGGDIAIYNGDQGQSTHSAHVSWWEDALPGGTDVGVTLICNNGKGSASLYSQARDIVELLADDPASRPFENITHATTPPRLQTGTWVLDASRAHVLVPAGMPLVPSAAPAVTLAADFARRTATFGKPGGGTGGAPGGGALGTLGNVALTSAGRLVGSGGTLQLPIGAGAQGAGVTLRNVALSLQVGSDGAALYDGRVTGRLDARELVTLGAAPSASVVCAAVAQAGEACGACADGVPACFPAALGGLTARRLR